MHIEQKSLPAPACHHSVPFPEDNQYDQLLMEPFGGISRFLFKGIIKEC